MEATDMITLIVAITAWMAWETRRMASISAKFLKASEQSQLGLQSIDLHQGPIADPAWQIGVQIILNPLRIICRG